MININFIVLGKLKEKYMKDFAVEETSKFSYISLTDAVRLNNWKYTMKTPSDL